MNRQALNAILGVDNIAKCKAFLDREERNKCRDFLKSLDGELSKHGFYWLFVYYVVEYFHYAHQL